MDDALSKTVVLIISFLKTVNLLEEKIPNQQSAEFLKFKCINWQYTGIIKIRMFIPYHFGENSVSGILQSLSGKSTVTVQAGFDFLDSSNSLRFLLNNPSQIHDIYHQREQAFVNANTCKLLSE